MISKIHYPFHAFRRMRHGDQVPSIQHEIHLFRRRNDEIMLSMNSKTANRSLSQSVPPEDRRTHAPHERSIRPREHLGQIGWDLSSGELQPMDRCDIRQRVQECQKLAHLIPAFRTAYQKQGPQFPDLRDFTGDNASQGCSHDGIAITDFKCPGDISCEVSNLPLPGIRRPVMRDEMRQRFPWLGKHPLVGAHAGECVNHAAQAVGSRTTPPLVHRRSKR